MRTQLPLLALASILVAPQVLSGQSCFGGTCQGATMVVATVGTMLNLSLDRSPTITADPTARDIAAGYQDETGPSARVRANAPWRLEVSSATETWQSAAGRTDKPASDLEVRAGVTGSYEAVTTAPTVAALGTPTSGTNIQMAYRAHFDAARDAPGSYAVVVRYTLTSR